MPKESITLWILVYINLEIKSWRNKYKLRRLKKLTAIKILPSGGDHVKEIKNEK